METQQTLKKTPTNWLDESVLAKLGLIGFLTILLLVPSSWIQDLIRERQNRQQEVMDEVSDKWSTSQLVAGPVMVVPYRTVKTIKDLSGKVSSEEVQMNAYLLPEVLEIDSKVKPETLHRGIFDAVVYTSSIKVKGKFGNLELINAGINPESVMWDKAKVVIGLSDLKGLRNNPVIKLGAVDYQAEPDFENLKLFENNLVVIPRLAESRNTALDFSFDLDLRGSSELNFQHLGKSTMVKIGGNWNNPSFTGRYLPEDRKVSENGFTATWKMPAFNRPYPQQWQAENASLFTKKDMGFGVKFILPVDQYQKTMRSAKYSVLIILLTFISLFFTEMIQKKKVHLLQYALIGAAMTIYYTLLLSFTERVGFNLAYLIASVATITLISTFITMLLNNRKAAIAFAAILTIFYGFVFVIIQLQDLALLFGSIGLFVIITVLMFFSAKMDWNKQPKLEQAA